MRLELSDVDLLKNAIPILAEIVDEGVFKVDKNGISLLSPDRAMVAVIDFRILSSAFDSFQISGELNLGLNLSNFVSILKRVKGSDKLILETEDGSNKLRLTLEGGGRRTFELPLLDISMERPPIDQLAFPGKIQLESGVFEDGVADAEIAGDSIVFEADQKGGFRMHTKGDTSSAKLEMKEKDKGLLSVEMPKAVKSRYPLEYLKKMAKASKLADQMTLEFDNDYPMRLGFKVIDKMNLSFILAPRVEE
jgi:proliferating cell nuclear antigen